MKLGKKKKMTTKKNNCAECNVEFTFEENPKYPRKYCLNCSAKKKAAWIDGKQTPNAVNSKDVEFKPEVVHVRTPEQIDEYERKHPKPKDNGNKYAEHWRSCALPCAIEAKKGGFDGQYSILQIAKEYEKYILTGE